VRLLQWLMQLLYVQISVPTVPIHVDTWNTIKSQGSTFNQKELESCVLPFTSEFSHTYILHNG
jgi:hypothetical protein